MSRFLVHRAPTFRRPHWDSWPSLPAGRHHPPAARRPPARGRGPRARAAGGAHPGYSGLLMMAPRRRAAEAARNSLPSEMTFFEFDRSELTDQAGRFLTPKIPILQNNPSLHIESTGTAMIAVPTSTTWPSANDGRRSPSGT